MVALESDNGDAIACLVLMIDDLASQNNSLVIIETFHDDGCGLFSYMEENNISNEDLGKLGPTSPEALEHLYACSCDPQIEAVFTKGDGETLLVPFTLGEMQEEHPWLKDKATTKQMLEEHKQVVADHEEFPTKSSLHQKVKPLFNKRMGVNVTALGYKDPRVH